MRAGEKQQICFFCVCLFSLYRSSFACFLYMTATWHLYIFAAWRSHFFSFFFFCPLVFSSHRYTNEQPREKLYELKLKMRVEHCHEPRRSLTNGHGNEFSFFYIHS